MGTTPKLGLPYPEPEDPVAQGASAIAALAGAVDAVVPLTAYGTWTGVTDANGNGVIAHGLGATPRAVSLCPVVPVGGNITAASFGVRLLDANNITFRAFSPAGAGIGGNMTVYWTAWA